MLNLRRSRILLCATLFALCLGCHDSSTQVSGNTNRRIEAVLRAEMGMPDDVVVEFGERKASDKFPGWDEMVITFVSAGGAHRAPVDFLISKDNKSLFQLHEYDTSSKALAKTMDKIDVNNRPFRGGRDAKVLIVNYDDLECPFCAMLHQSLFPATFSRYSDKIKVVYKDFPLTDIHPWAMHAAINASCLAHQNSDAYWGYVDSIHGHLRDIGGPQEHPRSVQEQNDDVDKYANEQAQQRGLNVANLQACIAKGDHSAIDAEIQEGKSLDVGSTPTMFVNGIRISGSMSEENLSKIIDLALEDAGETPPPAGSGSSK